MTDSHCHLDACESPEAAVDPELAAIVTIGTGASSSRWAAGAASTHPNVWAAVGVHPNDASDADDESVRAAVEALVRRPRVVAIGETGFDTHWDDETLESQGRAFRWQAALAAELDKALILHVRDAAGTEDASLAAAAAIRAAGNPRGVLHCCNGHPYLLTSGLELGWFVSFAGNLTYPSAEALRAAARKVPLDRLLVETDSPYLSPVPKRGTRNVPANVRHTAAFLADLLGVALADLERETDANAARLYGFADAQQGAATASHPGSVP